MNKIKEFLKKTRLTSYHLYTLIGLFMMIDIVIDGYVGGYEEYISGRSTLTIDQFEGILAWLAVTSTIVVADVVMSVYVWHKETKEDKDANRAK